MSYRETMFKGMLIGMKNSGAELVKTSSTHLYFTVKKGSILDNDDSMQRAKEAFYKLFQLGVKIKKID